MDILSIEHMKKHEMMYDLVLRLKDSDLPEDVRFLDSFFDKFGFWSPNKDVNGGFVTAFDPDRKSFVLKSPDGWNLGDMPVEGHYVLVKVWKSKVEGDKKWSINVSNFELKLGVPTSTRGRDIYLFCFLNRDEYLSYRIHDFCMSRFKDEMPEVGSKDYAGRLDWDKKVEEMRLECLEMAPELKHYTWPEVIVFSGEWEEKDVKDLDFFRETLSMLMGVNDVADNHLDFKTLEWKNGKSSLTKIVKYKSRNEYKLREYGVVEMVEVEKEIGVWFKKEDGGVVFDGVQFKGGNWFIEFSGKISEGSIRFEIETPGSKVGKDVMVDYFGEFGMEPVNLPE